MIFSGHLWFIQIKFIQAFCNIFQENPYNLEPHFELKITQICLLRGNIWDIIDIWQPSWINDNELSTQSMCYVSQVNSYVQKSHFRTLNQSNMSSESKDIGYY